MEVGFEFRVGVGENDINVGDVVTDDEDVYDAYDPTEAIKPPHECFGEASVELRVPFLCSGFPSAVSGCDSWGIGREGWTDGCSLGFRPRGRSEAGLCL